MSQTTSEAAAQPAVTPQTSAVEKPSGENVSGSQMRQILLQRDLAAKAPPPTATVPPPVETPAPTSQPVENQPANDSAPVEATPTDTPQSTEAQPVEAMPESVLSNLSSLDPETRKWVEKAVDEFKNNQQAQIDKRIGKERAKRGETERIAEQALQEVQALRQQLSQSQQQVPPISPTSPLAQVQDLNALQAKRNEAINVAGIVDDALAMYPSAEKITLEGKEWNRADLVDLRRNARELLTKDIPARQTFLQQRDQANQNALKSFPFLTDPASPEYMRADQIIRENNHWLQHQPNALQMVAIQVEGEKALAARRTAQPVTTNKPAAPAPRPSSDQVATTVSSAPERVSGEGRVKQAIDSEQKKVSTASNMSGAQTRLFLKRTDQLRNQTR